MVADFWAAVDYIAEKNLDQEDALEEARAAHSTSSGPKGIGTINPNLRPPNLPGWFEWRDKVLADYAAGKIPIQEVTPSGPPKPPQKRPLIIRAA